jgi:hypothetical protein
MMLLATPQAPSRWIFLASVSLAVVALSGCTPLRHHLEPYRDDQAAAHALETHASQVCVARRGATDQPPHAFTTDGCSMWPNGTWTQCCVEHDIAYWCGGSAEDREGADSTLRQCVNENRSACLGTMMYLGVRAGGIPWQPFPWRWGYGWTDLHGYDHPLAREEK